MNTPFLTLAPNLVSSLTLALVFAAVARTQGERYLAIWAFGWSLFAARYAYGLVASAFVYLPGDVVLPLLALARGTVVLWGALAMVGRPLPAWWLGLVAADVGLLTLERLAGAPLPFLPIEGLTHYTIFATALILSGCIVIGRLRTPGFGPHLAGASLIVLGLLQASFPWSRTELFPYFREVAFLTVQSANLGLAAGILLAHFAQASADARALSDRLAEALATALGEYVPICSHCHSIRDEESGWERLESYVERRTGSRLSHGICNPCMVEHYGIEPEPPPVVLRPTG